ncbi:MAG TPA: N-acetylmuramoyl-L-alanine amidase CwlD [Firmicutes bacterium]|nr:N-acetylmuramoyl-L-alanine amidase CwlD [Bacillota bacterium]
MFYAIKKNTLIFAVCAAALIIAASVVMIKNFTQAPGGYESSVATSAESGRVILIDAGHGGIDGGASVDGVLEKDINLKIASILSDYINIGGDCAVMTRESDVSLGKESGDTVRGQKRNDLKARVDMMGSTGADIMVSIHMNKFEQSQYRGAQVIYAENVEDSMYLAESIQTALREIDPENERQIKKNETGVYLLKNATIPSVIVECGFMSNPEELSLLQSEEYQKKIAMSIYKGIERYYSSANESGGAANDLGSQ